MPDFALPRRVLKFGGSSLATPERIRAAAQISRDAHREHHIAVVVSAWGGVTDDLVAVAAAAGRKDQSYLRTCDQLEARHREGIEDLLSGDALEVLELDVTSDFGELRDLLHGVSLVGECSARSRDQIICRGERISARIFAAVLSAAGTPAESCDPSLLIITDDTFGNALVDTDATYRRLHAHFGQQDALQVVPGFTGATRSGDTTTLGRGGSDLTASLVGAGLRVQAIELWTDVDGVLSADPRLVPGAFSLATLRYEELMELSHFGAKVVYPPSVHPARTAGIPLAIRNTLNPGFAGTWIGREGEGVVHPIRGISSINSVALMRLEGDGMVGVPGIAGRLFGALARQQISVILIGQASSEHSICFAVLPEAVEGATDEIRREFDLERRAGLIDELIVEDDLSIVAVVGEEMRKRPGIAGRVFSVLGDRGVNVRAIAQGSSELNISFVVDASQEQDALRSIHDAFFAEPERSCRVFVAGTGRVGRALLSMITAPREGQGGSVLRLAGVINSRKMCADAGSLGRIDWSEDTALSASDDQDADLDTFVDIVTHESGPRVFVDCSASETVPRCYDRLLESGVHVVSANKLRFAGPLSEYVNLKRPDSDRGHLYFETTVGAALPVIGTLQNLVATGDRIHRIEGLLSGTLGFVLHRVREGARFSEALREAHERGYTEPDPREDLTGRDVARKILILARLAGRRLEPADVIVEPVVPMSMLERRPLDVFWQKLDGADEAFAKRAGMSKMRNETLCYLARLDGDKAEIALTEVPSDHPGAGVVGTDSMVAFYTDRYLETPLVIRGPGAGPELTASGVYADIMRAVAEHHAP